MFYDNWKQQSGYDYYRILDDELAGTAQARYIFCPDCGATMDYETTANGISYHVCPCCGQLRTDGYKRL